MQFFNALYRGRIGTMTRDISAHGNQAFSQIHYLGFTCGIFKYRFTISQRRSHQNIFCARYRNSIKKYPCALESTVGFSLNVTVFNNNVRAHGL